MSRLSPSLICCRDRHRLIPSLAVTIMMQFVMQPGMVYQCPLWGVGVLLVGLAALGAVFFELAARQFLSVEFRRRHNDVTAAIFSVIGVTFAVLLAFVAMLAWDGFNKAKAASYAEASGVLDVYDASVGFADPDMSAMRDDIIGYLETVVRVEWPAQATPCSLGCRAAQTPMPNARYQKSVPPLPRRTALTLRAGVTSRRSMPH